MINPANEALREAIFDLESEMLTIDPEAGLEKIRKILVIFLVSLRKNAPCTLSEMCFMSPLIMRVTTLRMHFIEKAQLDQVAKKINGLIE